MRWKRCVRAVVDGYGFLEQVGIFRLVGWAQGAGNCQGRMEIELAGREEVFNPSKERVVGGGGSRDMKTFAGRVMGNASYVGVFLELWQEVVRIGSGCESRKRDIVDLNIAVLFHKLALVDKNFVVSIGVFTEEA